jgi:hypothetical protein
MEFGSGLPAAAALGIVLNPVPCPVLLELSV